MARLELAIAIKLIQNNFQKGIDKVRASLKSLQYQTIAIAGALGAGGFAISSFVGKLKEVARETNRANTVLKNVSKSTSDYADNVEYLKALSQRYKQDLNALTISYAKFKASADSAGLSVGTQQKVFDSVTRSLTAFGLGSQEANLALKAVQQMMSKGKISSEELRRQLGDQLPIAFEAMARAAGVSTAKLDELLKNGKLRAVDIMPKFAEELDKMTENVDTDNLETSLTQVGNELTAIVEEWGLVEKFKSLVDKAIGLLRLLKDEGSAIFTALGAGFLGSKMPNILKMYTSHKAIMAKAEAQYQTAMEQTIVRTKAKEEAEVQLARAKQNNLLDTSRLEKRVEQEKNRLERASADLRDKELFLKKARELGFWGAMKQNAVGALGAIKRAFSSVFSSLAWGAVFAIVSAVLSKLWEVYQNHKRINNLVKDYEKGIKSIDYGKQVSDLQTMLNLLKDQKASEASKQGLLSQINKEYGYSLKLNKDLSGQLEYQLALLRQQEQLRYHKEKIYESTKRQEEIMSYFKISENPKAPNSRENIEKVLREVAKLQSMGLPNEGYLVSQQLEKIEDFYDTQDWLLPIYNELQGLSQEWVNLEEVSKRAGENVVKLSEENYGYQKGNFGGAFRDRIKAIKETDKRGLYADHDEFASEIRQEAQKALQSYRELGIDDKALLDEIKGTIAQYTPSNNTPAPEEDGNSKVKETPLQKAEKAYAETITKLNNQKKNGLLTDKEYQDSIEDLSKGTAREIAGILGEGARSNATYNAALKGISKELGDDEKALQQARKVVSDTERRIEQLGLSEEQANKERISAYNRALELLTDVDSKAPSHLLQISGYRRKRDALIERPTKSERDTTFDYKKEKSDIAEEDIRLWEEYKDKLEEAQEAGLNVAGAIEEVQKQISTLNAALKINQLQEDVSRLNKELSNTTYSGVKQVADSTRHLVGAFKSMRNAFSDEDVDPFERLLNVFNALQQAIDGVLSAISMFEKIGEVSQQLDLARGALDAYNKTQTAQQAISAGTAASITGVAVAQAGATSAQSALAVQEIAMSKAVTKAKIQEMSAKTAAQQAALGPVGIASASAQIASFLALIKASSATAGFANGGLVNYGSTWGDRTLIRVNKGERVLNSEQQEWLQGLAKGFTAQPQGGNVRVSGEFRMRAGELYAVVKQEERRRKR